MRCEESDDKMEEFFQPSLVKSAADCRMPAGKVLSCQHGRDQVADLSFEAFLRQSGFTCDGYSLVDIETLESGGSLVLLKLEGFIHLYVDEPFDAYVLFSSSGGMNYGTEWFSTDEASEAQAAFRSRLEGNPNRVHRGTSAHVIGSAAKPASVDQSIRP